MARPRPWNGENRRKSTPEEREAYAKQHHGGGATNMKAVLGILATLATGYVALTSGLLTTGRPSANTQQERPEGVWRRLGEIEQRLAEHTATSNALFAEWRRDQQTTSAYRDKAETYRDRDSERMARIERKLDQLLLKSGVQVGSTVQRPPAISVASTR